MIIKSPEEALKKLGREIGRLEDAEDRSDVTGINYDDCHDSVSNAALMGWHLIDWTFIHDSNIFERKKEEDKARALGHFRDQREAECPELAICGDIATGVKHAKITRPRTDGGDIELGESDTTWIGMEVGNKGARTNVLKCKITINGESAVNIFTKVFDYWSKYLKTNTGREIKRPKKEVVSRQQSSIPRPGGYYCPNCNIAVGLLIPHSDTCGQCGGPYEDIPNF